MIPVGAERPRISRIGGRFFGSREGPAQPDERIHGPRLNARIAFTLWHGHLCRLEKPEGVEVSADYPEAHAIPVGQPTRFLSDRNEDMLAATPEEMRSGPREPVLDASANHGLPVISA